MSTSSGSYHLGPQGFSVCALQCQGQSKVFAEEPCQQVTVVANLAKWQGKYFRNFTYYQVIGVNLGKLEPGKYEVKWIVQRLVFV
jgi:hypothetical protein